MQCVCVCTRAYCLLCVIWRPLCLVIEDTYQRWIDIVKLPLLMLLYVLVSNTRLVQNLNIEFIVHMRLYFFCQISSFLMISWVLILRMSHVFAPIGYGYLAMFYVSIAIQIHIPCKNLHVQEMLLIWFRMVLTQITSSVYKDSFTLTCPPNINFDQYYDFGTCQQVF